MRKHMNSICHVIPMSLRPGDGEGGSGGAGGASDDVAAQLAAAQQQLASQQAAFEETQAELERFRHKHAEAEKHRKEQEAAAQKAAEEAARKSGDVEALENSWTNKYNTAVSDHANEVAALNLIIHGVTVGAEAKSMAAEIALDGSSAVLMPHIESRLTMEIKDGKPVVKVLGLDGKPSAMTLADLKTEISNNPAFAPIIKGSKANGSGSPADGSGGSSNAKSVKRSEFDAMNPAERSAHIKAGGKVVD